MPVEAWGTGQPEDTTAIAGYNDVSGDFRRINVDESGNLYMVNVEIDINSLSGQSVTLNLAEHSGLQVAGGLSADISGDYVRLDISENSGLRVSADISGATITATVQNATLDTAANSGAFVTNTVTRVLPGAWNEISGFYVHARVESINTSEQLKVEQQTATAAGGDPFLCNVSGQVSSVRRGAINMTTDNLQLITDESGGIQVSQSGYTINRVIIKNLSGNADMFIGDNATGYSPYSGYGYMLAGGESLALEMESMENLRVCANISGQRITYIAERTAY